jgi:hypothetical protein
MKRPAIECSSKHYLEYFEEPCCGLRARYREHVKRLSPEDQKAQKKRHLEVAAAYRERYLRPYGSHIIISFADSLVETIRKFLNVHEINEQSRLFLLSCPSKF